MNDYDRRLEREVADLFSLRARYLELRENTRGLAIDVDWKLAEIETALMTYTSASTQQARRIAAEDAL